MAGTYVVHFKVAVSQKTIIDRDIVITAHCYYDQSAEIKIVIFQSISERRGGK